MLALLARGWRGLQMTADGVDGIDKNWYRPVNVLIVLEVLIWYHTRHVRR